MNPTLEPKKPYTPPILEQHQPWQMLTGGSEFPIQDLLTFAPDFMEQ